MGILRLCSGACVAVALALMSAAAPAMGQQRVYTLDPSKARAVQPPRGLTPGATAKVRRIAPLSAAEISRAAANGRTPAKYALAGSTQETITPLSTGGRLMSVVSTLGSTTVFDPANPYFANQTLTIVFRPSSYGKTLFLDLAGSAGAHVTKCRSNAECYDYGVFPNGQGHTLISLVVETSAHGAPTPPFIIIEENSAGGALGGSPLYIQSITATVPKSAGR